MGRCRKRRSGLNARRRRFEEVRGEQWVDAFVKKNHNEEGGEKKERGREDLNSASGGLIGVNSVNQVDACQ